MQEQMTLAIGTTVPDTYGDIYRIEKLLSKGRSGTIYLVSQPGSKQRVFALKEVSSSSQQDRERLLFEHNVLKRLSHPALPRVYYIFEQEKLQRTYLLMEYIHGKDLEVLRNEQPKKRFPLELMLTILDPIADALIYLHQQEPAILHQDIKPANIIVPLDGSIPTLVDFANAKEYLPETTIPVFRHSSPGCTPLEQSSSPDIAEDVYALGATLYTLLTGVKPADTIKRVSEEKAEDALQPANVLVPDIPQPVSQAIQRALSISPEDRFATVEEFWYALHAEFVRSTGKM